MPTAALGVLHHSVPVVGAGDVIHPVLHAVVGMGSVHQISCRYDHSHIAFYSVLTDHRIKLGLLQVLSVEGNVMGKSTQFSCMFRSGLPACCHFLHKQWNLWNFMLFFSAAEHSWCELLIKMLSPPSFSLHLNKPIIPACNDSKLITLPPHISSPSHIDYYV